MNIPPASGFHESVTKHLASSPVTTSIPDNFVSKEVDIDHVDLEDQGIATHNILRNTAVPILYEQALLRETGTAITSTGALIVRSGAKTGRCPKDKRIVDEPSSNKDVWWGPVCIPMDDHTFMINRERAVDYLNTRDQLYVFDGYAGWDPKYRLKVRVLCSRAYHALFMNDMLIRPTREELAEFGEPDFIIYNAGEFPANRYTKGMTSSTSVSIHFARREMVILGTQYAGEMKKGVLTVMMYLMPKLGVLSMHASANIGKAGDVSVFFGLSGTGKTTLSADPNRGLIGDDEHVWTDEGVFNVEGGCYAKCVGLTRANEPEIYDAIKFGAVLENVVYDDHTREVNYKDVSITENTRVAYPLEHIPNAVIPAVGPHPKNVIMLTCDAFGVLPPVAMLTPEQAMYHFISGYTAKVAGTEVGITEPVATFSACFGEPFLVWHPAKYAELLAMKLRKHNTPCWLVNTGWSGGAYGVGKRMSLKYTRAIIDAIHSGELIKTQTQVFPIFNLNVPVSCSNVPSEILMPISTWSDKKKYDETLKKLAMLFKENFKNYAEKAGPAIVAAGPSFSKEDEAQLASKGYKILKEL